MTVCCCCRETHCTDDDDDDDDDEKEVSGGKLSNLKLQRIVVDVVSAGVCLQLQVQVFSSGYI